MLSHGNITHVLLGMMVIGMEMAKVKPPPVWNTPEGIQISLNVVPIYHSLGLYLTSFFNFLGRSTTVMLSKWNIEVFFDSIPKYQITNLGFVPSLIHQVVHHPRFKTADMSSVKGVGCGAAHLPPQLADQLRARFPGMERINQGYGLSEITMGAAMTPVPGLLNGRAKDKPDSVGILFPSLEARIVRPDGSPAGPNEPGELLLRGPVVALGYKGNEKATRETFVDGWLHTGDQLRIDEDGVLFFVDRTKAHYLTSFVSCCTNPFSQDTLKISGMQVSPSEIENALLAHPDKLIIDVAVAGVSGGRTSDERIPRAWVVLSPAGAALGEREVAARLVVWVQEQLSRYKWLRGGIEIVGAIPKSPTGKVLRRVLVEEYEKGVNAKAKL
ncbi:hypothetical protein AZE42_12404 [Rhizopogon vesiculosus]|uniref:AMP-dependent synthetase/ligase domain-containing protein n=1 Tax=Rhizopogon vesiculosus TaxID=180088 RepID=A0A1J8QNL6_9AGAM|nr:hypothetical protein AZE42_12404 [Rhizopogon vesiculosus]